MKRIWLILITVLMALMPLQAQQKLSQEETDRIALQAYLYTYPMVLMDVTRKQMTNAEPGKYPSRGPMMTFTHLRAFPPADFKEVVRPNFDTLYSLAWVDVSKEPAILSVPEVKDRFFMLPMLDMWTDVFAVVGTYANGTDAGEYALCMPEWKGTLPKGVKRIDVPTSLFWILGRTQTNGPKDYSYIHKIQDGFKVTPLSHYGKSYTPPFKKDPTVDDVTPPLEQVEKMDAKTYFNYAMALMKQYPPHATDMVMVNRMERIGLVAEGFDYEKLSPEVKKALSVTPKAGHKAMRSYLPNLGYDANGWQMITKSIGVYGNDYLQRATVNLIGLGANPYEQAIYPLNITDKNGKAPQGGKKYVMHFAKDALPPVEAFWSITMYDDDGFQVDNDLKRFAIGDRDELKYNKDGSLDIYMQPTSPGKAKESNWLPSPKSGTLGITMRLYAPKQSVLDGQWKPPFIEEVK